MIGTVGDVIMVCGIPAILIGSAGILCGLFGNSRRFDEFVRRLFE